MNQLGVVVIGRNEGDRLKRCIQSLTKIDVKIVYVDSASTDDSVAFVRTQGFDVVELDMSVPFSAARARNEGYQYLLKRYPELDYIQFVDGDCEVVDGWLLAAVRHLQQHANIAAVCGRRRERFPEKTIYNHLCDIEWNTPVGKAKATGGDFMCRVDALTAVNGFNPRVVAGEEPELCFRLRENGWLIERLDYEMTLHDAAMHSWRQWWKRCERSGHAYAQGYAMHGKSDEQYNRKDVLRIIFWAFVLPTMIIVLSLMMSTWFLILLLVYPAKIVQLTRIYWQQFSSSVAFAYAVSLVVGKFPQFFGVLNFCKKHFLKRELQIIEYKQT